MKMLIDLAQRLRRETEKGAVQWSDVSRFGREMYSAGFDGYVVQVDRYVEDRGTIGGVPNPEIEREHFGLSISKGPKVIAAMRRAEGEENFFTLEKLCEAAQANANNAEEAVQSILSSFG